MKKRILSLALVLMMIISLLPVTAFAADPMPKIGYFAGKAGSGIIDDTPVYYAFQDVYDTEDPTLVLGQQVAKVNSAPASGKNYVKFQWLESKNTLYITFNEVNYKTVGTESYFMSVYNNSSGGVTYSRAFDIEIYLVGENVINSGYISFGNTGKLTITGDPGASLDITTAKATGSGVLDRVKACGELLIKDTTVTMTNTYGSATCVIVNNGPLTIENSDVTLYTGASRGIYLAAKYNNDIGEYPLTIKKGSQLKIYGGLLQEDGTIKYQANQVMLNTKGLITIDHSTVELHRKEYGGGNNNYCVLKSVPQFIGEFSQIQVRGGTNTTPNDNYVDLTLETGTELGTSHGYRHFVAIHECSDPGIPEVIEDCTTDITCGCGKTVYQEGAEAHSFTTKASDRLVEGTTDTYYVQCDNCNVVSESLAVGNGSVGCPHTKTSVTVEGYAAKCNAPGLTDEIVCEVCNEVIQEQEPIPQLSETGEHTPGAEATCTQGQYCTKCEEMVQGPKYHVFEDHYVRHNLEGYTTYQVSKIPTCTEPGRTSYKTCENCDRIFRWSTNGSTSTAAGFATVEAVTSEIPALGHEYDCGFCIRCNVEDTESTDYVAINANGKKYRSLAAAIYNAGGTEITLQCNVTYSALTITKNTKINLNGYMLRIKNTDGVASAITVTSGKKLEISNGQLRVIAGNSFNTLIENNGTLLVSDVVIRGNELGGENAVILLNKGVATIEGASAVVAASKTNYAIVNKGTCEINIAETDKVDARIQGVLAQEEGELALTAINKHYGKFAYIAGKVTKGEAVSKSAPSGYVWVNNVLEVKNPVVEVNGVKYASLQEAIDKAEGAEIKLLKDTTADALVITKNTKINIGNYTLFIKQTGEKTVAITVDSGAALTLIGGKLRIVGKNIYNTFILVEENGKLVAEDVSIRGTGLGDAEAVALYNKGEAEIKGGAALVALTRDNRAIVNHGTCVIDIPVDYAATSRIYGAIENNATLIEKADYRHFGKKISN